MPEPIPIPATPPGWVISRIHTDRLCSRCEYDILARGVEVAPPPRRATFRVWSGSSVVERLCPGHLKGKVETNS